MTLLLMDLPGSSSMAVAPAAAARLGTACDSTAPAVTSSSSNSVLDVMNGLYVSSSMLLQRVDSFVLTLSAAEQGAAQHKAFAAYQHLFQESGFGGYYHSLTAVGAGGQGSEHVVLGLTRA